MENVAEKTVVTRVHHGHNVSEAMKCRKIDPSSLADLLGITVEDIAVLESYKTIDDALLDRIALALNVPVEILKYYESNESVGSSFDHNTISIETATNSLTQQIQHFNLDGGSYTNNFNGISPDYVKLSNTVLKKQEELTKYYKKEFEIEKNKKTSNIN